MTMSTQWRKAMSKQTQRAWVAVVTMGLLAGTTGAVENLYTVAKSGQMYTTIQEALNTARTGGAAGDTQIVRIMDSGNYDENLTLTGTWGTRKLLLEANAGQAPTLYRILLAQTIAEVTLKGLKFKSPMAGRTDSGGVEITQSSMGASKPVTITNCSFEQTGSAANAGWSHGVSIDAVSSGTYGKVTVESCNFDMTAVTTYTTVKFAGVTLISGQHYANVEVKDCVFLGGNAGVNDVNYGAGTMVALNIHNNLFHSQNFGGSHHAVSTDISHSYVTIENNTFVKIYDRLNGYTSGGAINLRYETAFDGVIKDNLIVDGETSTANAGIGWLSTTPTSCNADTNAFVAMTGNKVAAWSSALKTITDLNGLTSASGNFEKTADGSANNPTLANLFANYGGTDYRNDYRLKSGVWALTTASDGSYVGAFGQERPTVTVTANDAAASEAGPDTGQFTVSRGSRTDGALVVNYTLPVSGSATPGGGAGGDYTTTPTANYGARTGSVTISNGSSSNTVTVTPVNDATSEVSEGVVLTLASDAAYAVGSPASATVTIADDDAGNVAPAVEAGTNQTVVVNTLPTGNVTLDATLLADDGTPVAATFLWSKQSGPGTVTFPGGATALDTTATFSLAGTYVLLLTADDTALQGSDTVTIIVQDNEAPTVDAGNAQSATLTSTVVLAGTVTVDDGLPASPGLTYLWTQDSGPGTASFGTAANISTTVTFDQLGEYVLKLMATDGLGLFGSDTVTITVRANAAFTAIADGRFNAAATWDAPGGVSGPPLAGDTAGITNRTVETLTANEVPVSAIVNLSRTGNLRCRDSGATLSPVAATATINVSTGGTLRVDNLNNLVGTVNLNGGRLMQQNGSDIQAGATLNVNADSEIAAAASGDRCRIRAAVHGTGKLTVTGNPGSVTSDGFAFAAGSTWSGAWDIRSGYVRINTAQALPGDLRIANATAVSHTGTGITIKGVRSGGGSNQVYQAGILTVGNGTLDTPGRGWWSPGDVGINDDVGVATFGNEGVSAGYSPTLRFASNSVFVADIRGVTPDRCDRTVAFGMGSGTGKVNIVTGAILTVNLWTPTGPVTLNAKIIDTTTGKGGNGVLTGSFRQTNWVNSRGWKNLGVTVADNDLYVTGEYPPRGTVILIR
jgi:hypothetical protein